MLGGLASPVDSIAMALQPGQRVRTPHRRFLSQYEEGVYVGDAQPHNPRQPMQGPGLAPVPQGTVRYPDSGTHTWPRDVIEPLP